MWDCWFYSAMMLSHDAVPKSGPIIKEDYFVYHCGMVQFDQPAGEEKNGGGSFLRSVCIDYLYYNEEGTIKRVVQMSEEVVPAK